MLQAEGTGCRAEELDVSEELESSVGLEVRVGQGRSMLAKNEAGEEGRCQDMK